MSVGFARLAVRRLCSFSLAGAAVFVLAMAQPDRSDARHVSFAIAVGFDTIRGTAADNVLLGTTRNDLLDGGAGDDRLVGLEGDDVLSGGAGRDWLDGGLGNDVLEGGDGDDVVDGGDGMDFLFGDKGDDWIRGGLGADTLDGGEGNDRLDGGVAADVLAGGAGDDMLFGGPGNDHLEAGEGSDLLDGGDGDDVLDGGDNGNDILRGGLGNDTLYAGDDNSTQLDGGLGNDVLLGGEADDLLRGAAGNDALRGDDGNDFLDGGAGNDLLNGTDGNDDLLGGAGDDTLLGGADSDRLFGGVGVDNLRGEDGDDVLDGAVGDDALTGGRGTDVQKGGPGNDRFFLRVGDVDSAFIEIIDGGTNLDTLRADADTLLLNGFTQADVRIIQTADGQRIEIVDPLTHGIYIVTRVEKVVFLQVVPYVARAGESVLQVVNAANAELTGTLKFVGANGVAMPAAVASDSAAPTHGLRLPSRGTADLTIRPMNSGAIWIYTDQPVSAFVRTVLSDESVGVIPAGPLFDEFTIPVRLDRSRRFSSGFAVANDGVTTAMNVWLYTPAGAEIEATFADIASNGQVTRFLNDLFPRYDPFVGKAIIGGGPLIGVGLLLDDGRISVAPPVLWPGIGPAWVPHFVSGGGSSTTIRVFGRGLPRDTVKNGRITFFDNEGRPLAIDVTGVGRVTEVPFGFAPHGSIVVTTAASGPPVEGSAVVTTSKGAVVVAASIGMSGATRRVEIAASRGQRGFVAAARRDEAAQLTTVVALSAGAAPATVNLVLRGPDGQRIDGGEVQVSVPIRGHLAQPLERLFPRASISRFRGSLEATVSGGTIAATLIELGRGTAVVIPVTPFP